MPRIRTIKPAFWTDEKLAELPRDVRLLFIGLISAMADDEGRCKGNPRLVKAAVFPLDDDVTALHAEEWLTFLHASGRIQLYDMNGERYVQVVNWSKHQRIDRAQQSQLPAPDSSTIIPRTVAEVSTNGRRKVGEGSTLDVEVEGKGKERRTKPPAAPVGAGLQALPKDICDRLYERWKAKRGGVKYSRFRGAMLTLYTGSAPPFTEEQVAKGIDVFSEAANSRRSDDRRTWGPEMFVSDIHEYVRLGAMPLIGDDGIPTERALTLNLR